MVTEAELVGRLREFLSASDLNTTTTSIVRRKLEQDFGIDLSDKKVFIREQVDLYLQTQFENQQNEEEEEADEEEDEAQEADDDDDGGADEDKEPDRSSQQKAAVKKRSKKKNKEVKRRGGGGFTKVCGLSSELQKFTGQSELARTEVVKLLWQYIRDNNLQDPSDKRMIKCDDTFRDLFGVDTINMFQMNKALGKHIWSLPTDSSSGSTNSNSPQKEKPGKQGREEDPDELNKQEKRQKRGNPGILAPLQLSDALVRFLGTGETTLPRSDVVKRIWQYIKDNNLQDPSDKRRIICDEKLKELFSVDTFIGFAVTKFLTAHFIKTEQ